MQNQRFVKTAKIKPIQIALHPEHYSENGGNYIEILVSLFSDTINRFDHNFRANNTYSSLIKNERLIDYIGKIKTWGMLTLIMKLKNEINNNFFWEIS